MNLTKQPVYQKSERSSIRPTADEKRHMERVAQLPCIVGPDGCEGRTTVHHCGTGAGGRKNHKKVLPICIEHHLGVDGINSLSGSISRREWELKHGTEAELLKKLKGWL